MLIQVFLAALLFFDINFAGKLAVILKAYIFGSIIKHLLLPVPHLPQANFDQSKLLWVCAMLEGAQLFALLWLSRLKKQLVPDFLVEEGKVNEKGGNA